MSENTFNSGLERTYIPNTGSQPSVITFYSQRITAISSITGDKLYDFLDDNSGPNEVYPLTFAVVVVPPPSTGTNLFYIGNNQPTDIKFYDSNGVEKSITAIYLGNTLVYEE